MLEGAGVGFKHEIEAELFRKRPELARELLRLCAGIDVGDGDAEISSSDHTSAISVERRSDAVTLIRDQARRVVAAVIVEVQRSADDSKRLSWPSYVTGLRDRLRCPVTLLVVVPSDQLAAWARRPIDIGHPGFSLVPVVIGPADVPKITDPSGYPPELVILSALAHPAEDMIRTVTAVVEPAPEESQTLYLTLLLTAWPTALRRLLEDAMTPELQAQLKEAMYAAGRETGLEEGREKGLEEGREEGRLAGLEETAIALAHERGVLDDAVEAAIRGMQDSAALQALVLALANARSAEEARAALVRAGSRNDHA